MAERDLLRALLEIRREDTPVLIGDSGGVLCTVGDLRTALLREHHACAVAKIEREGLGDLVPPRHALSCDIAFDAPCSCGAQESADPDAPPNDEASAWCPVDRHGRLYLSRATDVKGEAVEDAKRLGSDSTTGAPELGPFTIAPLYIHPAASREVSEAMVERGAKELARMFAESVPSLSRTDEALAKLWPTYIGQARRTLTAALAPR